MHEFIQLCLSNLAIIFILHLCMDSLTKNKGKIKNQYIYLGCILLISASVIVMFYFPIKVINGIYIDLRLIPLIFAAYKWGWKIAIPVLFITSLWRFGMGGDVLLYAIFFGMASPIITGLIFRKFTPDASKMHSVTLFWMLIVSWLLCDIPIVLISKGGFVFYKEIFIIRFSSLFLSGFILNFFIRNSNKEKRDERKTSILC